MSNNIIETANSEYTVDWDNKRVQGGSLIPTFVPFIYINARIGEPALFQLADGQTIVTSLIQNIRVLNLTQNQNQNH